MLLHFVLYAGGNTAISLLHGLNPRRPASPYVFEYRVKELLPVLPELVVIGLLHYGLYRLMGADPITFAICDLGGYVLASTLLTLYIYTNHMLRPLFHSVDPVLASSSIEVPAWIPRMHCYFTLHTEHHLLPAMDSRWYPEVARLLEQPFPDRYQRPKFGAALEQIWGQPAYLPEQVGQPEPNT